MKILLAGATGAIGRPLLPLLTEAGHEVVALTRRPDRIAQIERAGARGVVCDVSAERAKLLDLAHDLRPDVVLDETTDLPQRYDVRDLRGFYAAMATLRLLGSPNLLDASLLTGARHVFQSIAFLHQPDGDPARPRTEDDPIFLDGTPSPWDVALPIIAGLERRVTDRGGLVLRYGYFYGPGTHFAPGGQIHDDVAARRFPVVGSGAGTFSFCHVEDAAAATLAALERPELGGILQVVDDDPVPAREWLPLLARELGAKRPRRAPAWLVGRLAGGMAVHYGTTLPAVSNARARRELAWAPAYPSVRSGGFFPARAAETRDARTEYAK